MTSRTVLLRDLVPELTVVLEELMASDLERRPFVIIQDTVTKKFVQFIRRYKPKTGELLFDVPLMGVVLKPCPGPAYGAELAADVMTLHFKLPDSAELVIRVDGDEAN